MLKISEQQLKQESKSRGYRPEMIEKVNHLLYLLEDFMEVPYLLHWRKQQINRES